jgi:hypothetical protein
MTSALRLRSAVLEMECGRRCSSPDKAAGPGHLEHRKRSHPALLWFPGVHPGDRAARALCVPKPRPVSDDRIRLLAATWRATPLATSAHPPLGRLRDYRGRA